MRTKGKFDVIDISEPTFEIWGINPVLTFDDWTSESMMSTKNGGFDIAHTYGDDAKSNAYFLAAAPDMHAALAAILRNGLNKETKKKAYAALRKAKVQP